MIAKLISRVTSLAPGRSRRLIAGGALALWLCGAGLACGYSAGLRVPAGARSIGIEIFGNRSPLRNLGLEVTAEVARAVTDLIHLPLVPPSEADYVVRGEVADYRRRSGPRDEDNRRLETGVSIVIVASLVRRGSDEVLQSTVVSLGTGIVIEAGIVADDTREEVAARDRLIENLATQLVLDLFRPRAPEEPVE